MATHVPFLFHTSLSIIKYGKSFAKTHGSLTNLWLLIVFEHVVVVFKLAIALLIPDIPRRIVRAMLRKKYRVGWEKRGRGCISCV